MRTFLTLVRISLALVTGLWLSVARAEYGELMRNRPMAKPAGCKDHVEKGAESGGDRVEVRTDATAGQAPGADTVRAKPASLSTADRRAHLEMLIANIEKRLAKVSHEDWKAKLEKAKARLEGRLAALPVEGSLADRYIQSNAAVLAPAEPVGQTAFADQSLSPATRAPASAVTVSTGAEGVK